MVRWANKRGKRQKGKLSEDGRFVLTEDRAWYARYADHNDVERHVSTKCSDKQAAQQVLNDLVTEAEKIRSGLKSEEEVNAAHHAKTSLSKHVKDYLEHLANKTVRGRRMSPVHVANVRRQLGRVVKDCRFRRIIDISKGKIAKWMIQQAAEGDMSGRTINTYRAAMMAFVRWLVAEERLAVNPLEELLTADETEKKRTRRSLEEEEVGRLLEVARNRPLRDAMTIRSGKRKGQLAAKVRPEVRERLVSLGYERALMYKCMIYTGLRRNELATLTVQDLNLDAEHPFVRLTAKNSINAFVDDISLRGDLAVELRKWISCKLPSTRVFTVPRDLRKILYRDLKKTGIPRVDDQGRQIDVHALRHTCGTQLARAGVSPQVASQHMRHSSMDLTLKYYTHLTLTDTGRAVEMLPDFKNHRNTNEAVKTGTDGAEVSTPLPPAFENGPEIGYEPQSFLDISCPPLATSSKLGSDSENAQLLGDKQVGSICHQMPQCPGLESNQHSPKRTSPSS